MTISDSPQDLRHTVGDAIFGLVLRIPASREHQVAQAGARARAFARTAARQAGLMAGSLALSCG